MEYKGYIGKVEFDDEAGIFHGEVINTRDVITFQGTSVAEIKQAFQEKTQKTPQQAIHIAEQRKRDYFERRSS